MEHTQWDEKWTKVDGVRCDISTLGENQKVAYGDGKTFYWLIETRTNETPKEDWQSKKEFLFGLIDTSTSFEDSKVIRELTNEVIHSAQKKLWDKIQLLIADEINISHSEGQPTSRLTSLFKKISDYVEANNIEL